MFPSNYYATSYYPGNYFTHEVARPVKLEYLFLHSPAQILRQLLVDLGYCTEPSLSAAWPGFVTTIPNTPDGAICVYDTAGVDHGRRMSDGARIERYGCQILVRAARHPTGYAKAQSIALALDQEIYRETVEMDDDDGTATYFVNTIKRTNPVFSIGQDTPQSKRKLFTINLTAAIRRIS